ncbi:hypothetical protein OH77DRAFT_1430261 [Trametes cingulata]|nr:hypothetical protein OH77DRAFT_1430261 [Trametes cingulata]
MPKTPELLPSLPPSPTPTDDVAHAWHDDDDTEEPSASGSNTHLSAASSARKGKGRSVSRERGGENEEEDEEELSSAVEGYPPTKEEEAESRRIEENLRRWEIAERQRRKAARESAASTSGGSTAPSLLADLRSSLFRRDSSRKASLGGVGTHHVLRTDDRDADAADAEGDGLPLADMQTPTGAAFSAPPTPEPENPFDTPSASRTSLNIPAHSAIMTESDSIPADFVEGEKPTEARKGPGPKRPTLEASSSFANPGAGAKKQPPPPPKPLDLPAPRSPPPRTATPHADKPPEPIPPPTPAPPEPEPIDEGPPVRWWHEWLCGCGEGPDRGGDHQAGRTNPFE